MPDVRVVTRQPSREQLAMPAIQCLVETGIYADDLDAAERFYRDVLGPGPTAGRRRAGTCSSRWATAACC